MIKNITIINQYDYLDNLNHVYSAKTNSKM